MQKNGLVYLVGADSLARSILSCSQKVFQLCFCVYLCSRQYAVAVVFLRKWLDRSKPQISCINSYHHLPFSVQFYCVHAAGLDGRLGQSWGDSGHWCYKQTWLYWPGTQEAWTLWPGVSVQPARQEGTFDWNINIHTACTQHMDFSSADSVFSLPVLYLRS